MVVVLPTFLVVSHKYLQASTPSGDNTDRNPMSMLSVSSESLDQLVSREKYLQSTFESLSGAELDAAPGKFENRKTLFEIFFYIFF